MKMTSPDKSSFQVWSFGTDEVPATKFLYAGSDLYLRKLFGFSCEMDSKEEWSTERSADTTGLLLVDCSSGRYETGRLELLESRKEKAGLFLRWGTDDGKLQAESHWSLCETTGVWSRKDRVINTSQEEIRIYRFLARYAFSPGEYELYSQNSRWIYENQGAWEKLSHGTRVLGCRRGRTCQNATPFVALREKSGGDGLAFQLVPVGNWTLKVDCRPISNYEFAFLLVEMGMEDENMEYRLAPGASLDSPEILCYTVPDGVIERSAPIVHRYVINRLYRPSRFPAPMVYNTWIDDFDNFQIDRLRKHMDAAVKIGCEVFVIDAGWFGEGDDWWNDVGDWREKKDAAFFGNLRGFADEVRTKGLGFGLWMEPERVAPKTPVFQAHPEWFAYGSKGFYYPKLWVPEAYHYIYSEICRLIDTYNVVWLKIDFNFELGIDPTGAEFHDYYIHLFKMLDGLRAQYPQVYFEGCSSGGLRTELNTVGHFDGHFLTDTVNPFYVLRISQGAMLRLPPGRLTKWLSIRHYQRTTLYENEVKLFPESLMTSKYCCWDEIINTDLDFAARIMMTGIFGLTGDVSNLPEDIMERLAFHIAFFKKWRAFIADSIGYLLTPVEARDHETGWTAIQLQNSQDTTSLLFVFRLKDMNTGKRIYLQGMEAARNYRIIDPDHADAEPRILTGRELMTEGLDIRIDWINRAAVFEVVPV